MNITKNTYLKGFAFVVILLTIMRFLAPEITKSKNPDTVETTKSESKKTKLDNTLESDKAKAISQSNTNVGNVANQELADSKGNPIRHKIVGVPSYREAFPDSQQVQLESALEWGVMAVENRADAEARKHELVYMAASPYYNVDTLKHSVPYLVPRAAVLLNDIGRAYFDSLQIKGLPLHRFIITSVLRTRSDVGKLRKHNRNATENSCHLYGTTFDISYRRYIRVTAPGTKKASYDAEKLKQVLSEVLYEMRHQGRCYVKHEVKQGCFHVTVR